MEQDAQRCNDIALSGFTAKTIKGLQSSDKVVIQATGKAKLAGTQRCKAG